MYKRIEGGYEVTEGPFVGCTVVGKSGNFHAHAPDGRAGPTKRTRQQALDALEAAERPTMAVAADCGPELVEVDVAAPQIPAAIEEPPKVDEAQSTIRKIVTDARTQGGALALAIAILGLAALSPILLVDSLAARC